MHPLLLYDLSVYLIITTGVHPFIYMLCAFVPCIFYYQMRTEFCAAIAGAFFGAMLRKTFKTPYKYDVLSLLIVPAFFVNWALWFLLQLFVDYYVFARQSLRVYQQKTYNRFVALILVVILSGYRGEQHMDVAIVLVVGVAHGAMLQAFY